MPSVPDRGGDLWWRLGKSTINTFLTSETIKVWILTDYVRYDDPNCGSIQDRKWSLYLFKKQNQI